MGRSEGGGGRRTKEKGKMRDEREIWKEISGRIKIKE